MSPEHQMLASLPPFLVLALPRSRTTWLSKFLTYGPWICGHEEQRFLRSLDDIRSWCGQSFVGSCETGAAPHWRLLRRYAPGVRIVTVRRPVEECVENMLQVDMQGTACWTHAELIERFKRLDAKLDQIAARWPNVLSVPFDALNFETCCARIFEHCLALPHDPAWWRALAPIDIQCSMPALMRYVRANALQLEKLAKIAKQSQLTELRAKPPEAPAGITFALENFAAAHADAQALARQHLVEIDEAPDTGKNWPLLERLDELGQLQVLTARSNGRMFGYLVTMLYPSLEDTTRLSAVHTTFYASPEFPGLGLKLQRAALGPLRARGVSELWLRAGTRGAGSRIGTLARRLGAAPAGDLWRLELEH